MFETCSVKNSCPLRLKPIVLILLIIQAACSYSEIPDPATSSYWQDNEDSETQSIMQTLAISISRMEDATARDLSVIERREAIINQLVIIEELSELLAVDSSDAMASTSKTQNHQVLNDHISAFLAEVRQARSQVLKNPPNYFPAGKVAGHCQVCHQFRDNLLKQ